MPLRIAHRGASHCEPENTMPAFLKALEMGADIIEVDVHHLRNGRPVVSHGKRDGNAPYLSSVLAYFKDKCVLKVDIRTRNAAAAVIRLLAKYRNVIVASPIPAVLVQVRQSLPDIKLELGGRKSDIKTAKRVGVRILGSHYSKTTKRLVKEAHRAGLEVHVWTVDDPETIKRMKRIGVDGITSNCPNRI